jgi:hypothetical protein
MTLFAPLFPLPCTPRAPIAFAARSFSPVSHGSPWTATTERPLLSLTP